MVSSVCTACSLVATTVTCPSGCVGNGYYLPTAANTGCGSCGSGVLTCSSATTPLVYTCLTGYYLSTVTVSTCLVVTSGAILNAATVINTLNALSCSYGYGLSTATSNSLASCV